MSIKVCFFVSEFALLVWTVYILTMCSSGKILLDFVIHFIFSKDMIIVMMKCCQRKLNKEENKINVVIVFSLWKDKICLYISIRWYVSIFGLNIIIQQTKQINKQASKHFGLYKLSGWRSAVGKLFIILGELMFVLSLKNFLITMRLNGFAKFLFAVLE